MSQQFDQNPIKFECDIQDGRGMQQYWYTPINKNLYIEPEGVSNQNVNNVAPGQPHGSGIPGMIEISPDTQDEKLRYIYNATRAFREHFDVEWAGGVSELPSKNGSAPPPQQEGQHQPDIQVSTTPIPQETKDYGNEPVEMFEQSMQLDIDEYARKEYGALIEKQFLINNVLTEIMKNKLLPDDDSHSLISMLQKETDEMKERYYGEKS